MNKDYGKILNICIQKFKYLNYSENTSNIYAHYIKEFLVKTDKYIEHIVSNDMNAYLTMYRFSSISQQNQIISALAFLYKKVLNKKYDKVEFTRPIREKKLPKIIDKTYLINKILRIKNLKHKAILALAYSTGLRVSEVINLKINDIDSKRMIVKINQSKGNKDRIVPLTNDLLKILREYYLEHKPKEFLFNGQKSLKYSAGSCNQLVKRHIGSEYHFHLLRHSCFTHLTDQGVDIRVIQKLAGHSNPNTTAIYAQVSTSILHRLPLGI